MVKGKQRKLVFRWIAEPTESPAMQTGGTFSYDFSTGASQAYGGTLSQKELTPGIWGLISGDGNADGMIGIADKDPLWDDQSGEKGYHESDYNLDAEADNRDKNDFWLPNLGKGSQIPD